ncbi:MAG: IS21 family transposase [Saprospiraceae bacterium]
MNRIRLIMQSLGQGERIQEISRKYGISRNTIKKYRKIIKESGNTYSGIAEMEDEQLSEILETQGKECKDTRYERLNTRKSEYLKMLSKKHITKQMLWEQYREEEGSQSYSNSQFSYYLHKWERQQRAVMVIGSKPGERLEVDYAGDTLKYIEKGSGQIKQCEVLVCVLPYSDLIYCEAQTDQSQMNFVEGIGRALQYIGGVPKMIISDNLKSGVKKADRYEPELTELCEQMSLYYQTHMTATRVRKPRDKASVERSVSIVYQRIYAIIEDNPLTSLEELNELMSIELEHLNNRRMERNNMSRWEEYNTLEKQHMQALRVSQLMEVKKSRVGKVSKNYHIMLTEDKHYYSVPKEYVSEEVKMIYTLREVEIYKGTKRIALHMRDRRKHQYTTKEEHMPTQHQYVQKIRGYTADDLIGQAKKIGEHTLRIVTAILNSKQFIEQSYLSAVGVIQLQHKYTKERVEKACSLINPQMKASYMQVKTILDNQMDKMQVADRDEDYKTINHENIRYIGTINTNK